MNEGKARLQGSICCADCRRWCRRQHRCRRQRRHRRHRSWRRWVQGDGCRCRSGLMRPAWKETWRSFPLCTRGTIPAPAEFASSGMWAWHTYFSAIPHLALETATGQGHLKIQRRSRHLRGAASVFWQGTKPALDTSTKMGTQRYVADTGDPNKASSIEESEGTRRSGGLQSAKRPKATFLDRDSEYLTGYNVV